MSNEPQQRRDDSRIEAIQRDVSETHRIAVDTQKGLGAVQLALSEHHSGLQLLRQTVDNMAERNKAHCRVEEEFFDSTEKRVRKLEDWKLSEETAMRTLKRDIAIIVTLGAMLIPLTGKVLGMLFAWMMR